MSTISKVNSVNVNQVSDLGKKSSELKQSNKESATDQYVLLSGNKVASALLAEDRFQLAGDKSCDINCSCDGNCCGDVCVDL